MKIVLTYVRDAALSSRSVQRNSPLIKTRLAGRADPAAFTLTVPVATKCTTSHSCRVTAAMCEGCESDAWLHSDPVIPT